MTRSIFLICIAIFISSCSKPNLRPTLRDIDANATSSNKYEAFIKPKSEEEIRQAYATYLKNTNKNDTSRMAAINRLAELEFQLAESLVKEKDASNQPQDDDNAEALYKARLEKTIELLKTTVRDYPDAKNNDKILYQLAKAYDQSGEHNKSIAALNQLAAKFKKSPFYPEAQFRLAEDYFSRTNYLEAELAYSEVIGSQKSDVFYEKALFKRGWCRFKQEVYEEAIADFMNSLTYHDFAPLNKMDKSEREQFDEYFRSIGLSFSYLGDAKSLTQYFKDLNDFKYTYYTYLTVSNVYLKQERYSDAAETLQEYISHYPEAGEIPTAKLAIINIWKAGSFENKLFSSIDDLYVSFNPDSAYWKTKNLDQNIYKTTTDALKEHIKQVSSHYHKLYQDKNKPSDFTSADTWYKRYLKHYSSTAKKDNIYYLYAELLNQNKSYDNALKYYELAAFDDDIILSKESAYAAVITSDKLINDSDPSLSDSYLKKHIKYATLFGSQYNSDARTSSILLHAAELSYNKKYFKEAIQICQSIPETANSSILYSIDTIKGQAYLGLKDYENAEKIYIALSLNTKYQNNLHDTQAKLAYSIYQQAESSLAQNNPEKANFHYTRISDLVPEIELAQTALYNSINLCMTNKLWNESIQSIKKFQNLYPNSKYAAEIDKKLSTAYLSSNQNIEAAKQFEKISRSDKNTEVRMAALWQAAELYESKKDYPSAIRSYTEYADTFKTPYAQYIESMYKISTLNSTTGNTEQFHKWNMNIVNADNNTPTHLKNDRTKYLVSFAGLDLAKQANQEYQRYKLVEPLKINLKKKKTAMLNAVNMYGQASTYGISDIVTESTYSIAQIYRDFSQSLLKSEIPSNLNDEEKEQYKILLEDQAFPFEEKAIEFSETNILRVKDGTYDKWIKQSHDMLKDLFPTKYNREAKLEPYINVFN